MKNKYYLYVLIRKDIPNVQKIIQCGHAIFNVSQAHKLEVHPFLVVIGIKDEIKLLYESKKLENSGLKGFFFKDDILNNETTAVAFLVNNEKDQIFFKKYQLLTNESFLSLDEQKKIKIDKCAHKKVAFDYIETLAYEFTPIKVCKFCKKEITRVLTDQEKESLYKRWSKQIFEKLPSKDEIEKNKNGFNI